MNSVKMSVTADNLVQGGCIITVPGTVASGQNLVRGTVVGRITTGGQLKKLDKTAVDGSQNFYGIISVDTDATSAATKTSVYTSGMFDATSLIFAAGTVVADVEVAARDLNCYFVARKESI